MYKPREDSFLIARHIKEYIKPDYKILDMGTGSALLAKESAKYCKQVIAVDINKKLISKLKRENRNKAIQFISSDLFSNIQEKFDLIIFNPPYLPSKQIKDKTIDGGKNGTEIIERFLKQAKDHLKPKGKILIICSSLNKNIEQLFKRYEYKHKLIDKEAFFFEKLFLYELKPGTKNKLTPLASIIKSNRK